MNEDAPRASSASYKKQHKGGIRIVRGDTPSTTRRRPMTKLENIKERTFEVKASLRQVRLFKNRIRAAQVALGGRALARVAEPLVAVAVAASAAVAHVMGLAAEVAEAAAGIKEEEGLTQEEALQGLVGMVTAISEGLDEEEGESKEETAASAT